MEQSKSVRFANRHSIFFYDRDETSAAAADWERQSANRSRNERRVVRKPESQLETMCDLVASWREHETCVVFGNLGRQPHLLHYFLDLCFGAEDDVRVECEWELPVSYKAGGLDFLIVVEPKFGYCVKKPADARHLIVLTSHMCLDISDERRTKTYLCHLPTRRNRAVSSLADYEVFKPPVFHAGETPPLPDAVLLDVTEAESAREAYLRLLTGREMIRNRPFKVKVRRREALESFIRESRRRAEMHWRDSGLEDVYWNGFF